MLLNDFILSNFKSDRVNLDWTDLLPGNLASIDQKSVTQDLYNPCKLKVTVQLDKQYNIELMIPNRRTSLIFHYYIQNAIEKNYIP